MQWIILGSALGAFALLLVLLPRLLFRAPKNGVVKRMWRDRNELPSLLSRIPLILLGALFKKEGRFYPGLKDFPNTQLEVGASAIEAKHLAEYYAVCGFEAPQDADRALVPPCYPVMSIFAFQPFLVSMPSFPVSPLGVIHIRTVIVQSVELRAGMRLSYEISMNGHRATERGAEVDFVIKARSESGNVVWECIETMLSRKRGSGGGKKKNTPATGEAASEPTFDGSDLFPVPENTGRRYASVVGDYNPHHMHKLPAMIFGFPKPIAHGQWSLEHSIARLQSSGIVARPPFKIDCQFKLPIYMPGKCLLRWNTSGAPRHASVSFELRSADGKLPHLAGKLENLESPEKLQ